MIRICPECLHLNQVIDVCETCGFPLNKKIIGKIEDYFFYDAIELYNLGHYADAEKRIRDKQSSSNDPKIRLLIEKFEMGNNLIKHGEDCATRAEEQLLLGNLQAAMNEINAASAVFSSPRFVEIEAKIKLAQKEKEIRDRSHTLFNDAKSLFEKESLIEALQTLQEVLKLSNNNPEYKAEFERQVGITVSTIAQRIRAMLVMKDYNAAAAMLSQILPFSAENNEIRQLNEEVNLRIDKLKKRKRILFTAVGILAVMLLISSIWFLSESNRIKSQWQQALQDGSIPSIENYISNNPNSKYLPDAVKKLKEIKDYDSTEWVKANKFVSPSSMQAYLNNVTIIKGLHMEKASAIIDSIDWFAIEKSEDSYVLENYISSHPTSQYISQARNKAAAQVIGSERDELLNFLNEFYQKFADKDLHDFILYFEPITPVFGSRKNISKADLLVLLENDIKTIRSIRTTIDPSSFIAKRGENNNYFINFHTDTYTTRILPETSEEESTDAEFFTNSEWSIILNERRKVISYSYNILSEKQINQ